MTVHITLMEASKNKNTIEKLKQKGYIQAQVVSELH